LRMAEGNVTQAAHLAQRNRTDFYKLMKRHGIERDTEA
jgi:two-component system, NtrC family, response regulator GlrR